MSFGSSVAHWCPQRNKQLGIQALTSKKAEKESESPAGQFGNAQ
jgi:hypothetical protein